MVTVVEGELKASFSLPFTTRWSEGRNMLYTPRIRMKTTLYKYTSGLFCSGTNVLLLTSEFSLSTRGEIQFLKVFRNHTMQTTSFNGRNPTLCPNGRNSTIVFHGPTSKSQLLNTMGGTQLLNIIVGPQLQLSGIETDNPTVCLHSPQSTPNWRVFKIFKFSAYLFRAWRHSHSSHISYLGFIMTIVIVISFAHERKLYPML